MRSPSAMKLLFLFLLFPFFAHGQGTQIVTVATDPATCKEGMIYANSTTHTQKLCGPANTWVSVGSNSASGPTGMGIAPAGSISPLAFGAKFDAGTASAATTTSGNNIVTCSGCKFQTGVIGTYTPPATVGQIFFANDATAGGGGVDTCLDNPDILFGGLRQTTISTVDSDTQIHVVGNSGTTSTAHACIAWGTDDTTAINSAFTSGGCTSSQWLPIGKSIISAPIWQAIAGCPAVSNAGTGFQSQRIWGTSVTGTYIIPVPLFDFSTVLGSGSPTCAAQACKAAIGNPNISDYESLNVWGMGERCNVAIANTTLWMIGASTRAININGIGWCGRNNAGANNATLSGFNINGGTDIFSWGGAAFFGSVEVNVNSTLVSMQNNFFSGNPSTNTSVATAGIQLQAGATVSSIASGFNLTVQVGQAAGAGATFTSQSSQISGNPIGTADSAMVFVGLNSTLNLLGNDLIISPGTNESGITFFATGGRVNASYSVINANGTGSSVLGVANNTFVDVQGNTFSGGAGKWNGLGSFVSDGSLTSTAPTISSGFGTSPAILKHSGAASFTVNVGTGGAASSGVIGLPTALNGWTCGVYNQTAHAANRGDDTVQTANTTNTVTVQNQTKSTGAALAWTASDTLNMSCRAN